MANSPIEPHFFASFDGERLAWREVGEGRAVVLIHGFFSDAHTNWIRYGHAATVAAAGFRVIMPDLRAHGSSAKPHDSAAYPPDVLMRDQFALIEHLGLTDYDLGGYSLGARTTMRMLASGATPRRAILSGMGLTGITRTEGRGNHFRHILTNLGSFKQGSSEWLAEAFLKTTKGDPVALLHILDTFVDTPEQEVRAVPMPVLVLQGSDDGDNGSARDLADALAHATYREIPGGHMSAVLRPELGQEIADYLTA
ncbi:alpha/beta fold hydrolase [Sphingomonas bacterium]|uniref:alpha/beta fold hydrolase n=1 Tax=Sphingomonas bacterium TaxID=1895847 RepID=UPI0026383638|nr:alpha/beta fold hydrolase [Sphingomonas bacterium]MDB5678101.1 hydrolase [Sphingomonas bacterium]